MKFLRWAGASLLGLVGTLLAVVGGLLTGTLVLAPVGIPLLLLAWRILRVSGRLVVPRAVRHPLEGLERAASDVAAQAKEGAKKSAKKGAKEAGKAGEDLGKRARRAGGS